LIVLNELPIAVILTIIFSVPSMEIYMGIASVITKIFSSKKDSKDSNGNSKDRKKPVSKLNLNLW
jgi:hypothetical protein